MPKVASLSSAKNTDSTPCSKKPKITKEKAIRSSTATVFYFTPGQFKFINAHRDEYKHHKRSPEGPLVYLRDLWDQFLNIYPEHDIPPFPEDAEMVERFHMSRAKALGYRLDNMIDFAAGVQHRIRKA